LEGSKCFGVLWRGSFFLFDETLAWQWGGELWAFPSSENGEWMDGDME
jgi:hypothetical protein